MPSFRTKQHVPFRATEMYAVVADIEKYPEFLPFCTGLIVHSKAQNDNGTEKLVATMSVGHSAIDESFTTEVTLRPDDNRIDVAYLDGPFRYLQNIWTFEDASHGCYVDFFIDYEFKSMVLGLLVGAMFDRAFRKFTDAFVERAKEIYGSEQGRQALS